MPFFGLSNIRFNQDVPRTGPQRALEDVGFGNIGSTTLRYPLDVGSVDKGHYMVFFVREQTNTQFSATNRGFQKFSEKDDEVFSKIDQQAKGFGGGGVSAGRKTFADTINDKLTSVISKGTSKLTTTSATGGKVAGYIDGFVKGPQPQQQLNEKTNTSVEASVKSITDKNTATALGAKLLKRTVLTSEAIALYMPDTLNFDSSANYSDVKPGEELMGQLLTAAPNLIDRYRANPNDLKGLAGAAFKSGLAYQAAEKLAPDIARSATGRLGLFAATGGVTNPMIELIYTSPSLREFQFEFFFYPRDEKEAIEVQKIIDRFRFHQSPELSGGLASQNGLLIPPSEFELKFYYAGRQNPNIPPIGRCVLKSLQVNFAPRGFSAYESVGENLPALGRTGMPITIQMSLSFQETSFITKEDFDLSRQTSASGKQKQLEAGRQALGVQGGAGFGFNKIT